MAYRATQYVLVNLHNPGPPTDVHKDKITECQRLEYPSAVSNVNSTLARRRKCPREQKAEVSAKKKLEANVHTATPAIPKDPATCAAYLAASRLLPIHQQITTNFTTAPSPTKPFLPLERESTTSVEPETEAERRMHDTDTMRFVDVVVCQLMAEQRRPRLRKLKKTHHESVSDNQKSRHIAISI